VLSLNKVISLFPWLSGMKPREHAVSYRHGSRSIIRLVRQLYRFCCYISFCFNLLLIFLFMVQCGGL